MFNIVYFVEFFFFYIFFLVITSFSEIRFSSGGIII